MFSTYENWHFKSSLFVAPGDLTPFDPFHALWKAENAFLAITFWGSTKLAMSTLELVKNGRVGVLSNDALMRPKMSGKWKVKKGLKSDWPNLLFDVKC